MRRIFLDTSYLLAVLIESDGLHDSALRLAERLSKERVSYVTTQFVIAELLASVSRRGSHVRSRTIDYLRFLISQPTWTTQTVSREDFDAAMDLYRRRPDQRYSLTDCVSMTLCEKMGITDVLTSDSDFTHEGFTILLGR